MPTYDYRCQNCGVVFEVHATIAEKRAGLAPKCPDCHGDNVRQVLRAPMLGTASRGNGGASCCGPGAGTGCCS